MNVKTISNITLLSQIIKEHLLELEDDLEDEPNHNTNHLASMISGEIDGLNWVLDQISDEDSNFNKLKG